VAARHFRFDRLRIDLRLGNRLGIVEQGTEALRAAHEVGAGVARPQFVLDARRERRSVFEMVEQCRHRDGAGVIRHG